MVGMHMLMPIAGVPIFWPGLVILILGLVAALSLLILTTFVLGVREERALRSREDELIHA